MVCSIYKQKQRVFSQIITSFTKLPKPSLLKILIIALINKHVLHITKYGNTIWLFIFRASHINGNKTAFK